MSFDAFGVCLQKMGRSGSTSATLTHSSKSCNRNGEGNIDRPCRKHVAETGHTLRPDVSTKNLMGIPWRVALALQADGWLLRSDIIWHKPNPMPESVRDRPTKSHEYLFMFSKSQRYHWDQDAVREPSGSNARSVWSVPTQAYPGAHFAVMPERLAGRCIRAGSAIGDTVLDPFSGAGTTGVMARRLQRQYVGIELNDEFARMSRRRIEQDQPLFNR